ncbi:hypothetical protein [Kitasatospora sp. NPDC048538]|uniref:hypothetical protein n=1 Tax=unclassified Kitasatospora TaxID=2633591 RepID=UPI0033F3915D
MSPTASSSTCTCPTPPAHPRSRPLLALIEALPPADPAAHIDQLITQTHTLNAGRHTDDLAVLRLDWGTHRHGHAAAEQRLG